jgi:itaconate CoA-transferase
MNHLPLEGITVVALADLAEHPQPLARNRWRTGATPAGDIGAMLPPVQMPRVAPVMGPVPALGEHSEAIRAEFAPDAG